MEQRTNRMKKWLQRVMVQTALIGGVWLLSLPLGRALHVQAALVATLLIMAGGVWIGIGQWRQAESQKRALQARFDAEDEALFGRKPEPL